MVVRPARPDREPSRSGGSAQLRQLLARVVQGLLRAFAGRHETRKGGLGFGHGGAFATNGFIDPKSGLVTVFMVQNVLVPDSGKPKDAFQRLVMEAAGIAVKPAAAKKQ